MYLQVLYPYSKEKKKQFLKQLLKQQKVKTHLGCVIDYVNKEDSSHSHLKASRPLKTPFAVSGFWSLRKSFSKSLATDFCTSLQYGEWKIMNPKSFKVKRLSVPSGSGTSVELQPMFSTHFNYGNKAGSWQDTSHRNMLA